jgi:hypothetical protein
MEIWDVIYVLLPWKLAGVLVSHTLSHNNTNPYIDQTMILNCALPEFLYLLMEFLSVFLLLFYQQWIYWLDYGRKCFIDKTLIGNFLFVSESVSNKKNIYYWWIYWREKRVKNFFTCFISSVFSSGSLS